MPDAFEIALTEKITRMCVAKEGATTYYVDGTSGNDGANGLTWESAKKTIQAAVDIADTWADIYVKAGTYVEEVVVESDQSGISIIGENNANTIIHPAGSSSKAIHFKGHGGHVRDLTAWGSYGSGVLIWQGDYGYVKNVKVIGTSVDVGLYVLNCDHMLVDGVTSDSLEITPLVWLRATVVGNCMDCVIKNCRASGCRGGIAVDGTSSFVHDNTVDGTALTHHSLDAGSGAVNCSIYHNNVVNCACTPEDDGTGNSFFENYYSAHTNVDNGSGIAVTPYAIAGTAGNSDPRPVIVRNGWLAAALSGVNGNNIANLSGREITGNTGAIAAGAETVCSAVIGQSGKRSELTGGIIRGVQTLGAGEKATVRVYKYNGGTWDKVDDYDVTKNSGLEANIGHAGHNDYMKISILHDGAANATFTYAFIVKDMEA